MKQGVRKAWPSAPMFTRGYMSSWDTNTLQFTCYFSAPRPCFTLKRELTTRLQLAVFSYRSVIFQVGLLQWLHGTPSFAVQLSVWSGRLFIEAKQCCNCWTGKEPEPCPYKRGITPKSWNTDSGHQSFSWLCLYMRMTWIVVHVFTSVVSKCSLERV